MSSTTASPVLLSCSFLSDVTDVEAFFFFLLLSNGFGISAISFSFFSLLPRCNGGGVADFKGESEK